MPDPLAPFPAPVAGPALAPARPSDPAAPGAAALRAAAVRLEASFLAAMLQAAGAGAPRESMGGGAGEAQFASFLVEAKARGMAERGGIGLAEAIFQALRARQEGVSHRAEADGVRA